MGETDFCPEIVPRTSDWNASALTTEPRLPDKASLTISFFYCLCLTLVGPLISCAVRTLLISVGLVMEVESTYTAMTSEWKRPTSALNPGPECECTDLRVMAPR